jgi:hypothetical protein
VLFKDSNKATPLVIRSDYLSSVRLVTRLFLEPLKRCSTLQTKNGHTLPTDVELKKQLNLQWWRDKN